MNKHKDMDEIDKKYVVAIFHKLGYKSHDSSFDISSPRGVGVFLGYCEAKIDQGYSVDIERFTDMKPILDSDLAHPNLLKNKFTS